MDGVHRLKRAGGRRYVHIKRAWKYRVPLELVERRFEERKAKQVGKVSIPSPLTANFVAAASRNPDFFQRVSREQGLGPHLVCESWVKGRRVEKHQLIDVVRLKLITLG